MPRRIRKGTRIIPKMGSYKGHTIKVAQVAKVKQGNRRLGTRTGQTIYFCMPRGGSVFYTRKDFKLAKRRR